MDGKAAPNGVATIEDRILRITGYYGYYPGYSSQKIGKELRAICRDGCMGVLSRLGLCPAFCSSLTDGPEKDPNSVPAV